MHTSARRGTTLLALAALTASAACTPPPPDPTPVVYPGAEWERVDPAEAGFDPAVLEAIAADAAAEGSDCLVVIRDGRLVGEWYWRGTDATSSHEVFSITKSMASTLVGIAQADGDLAVTDPAADYVPQWAGTPAAAVTVENLLSNDSGRHWDLATDYISLVQAGDRTAFATGLAQDVPPGQRWNYNNAAIQTLDAVVGTATGQEPNVLAEERVLGPTGMARTDMTRDPAGNTNMYFGMQSTCQDLARFGYLFLRDGRWDGSQLVPSEWVDAATGHSSQEINTAYGYLWWVNEHGPILGPLQTGGAGGTPGVVGRLAPEAPDDMFWARGLGGQVVQVDPGSETVVVRLGPGDRNSTYDQTDSARVVTEALVDP